MSINNIITKLQSEIIKLIIFYWRKKSLITNDNNNVNKTYDIVNKNIKNIININYNINNINKNINIINNINL